MLYAEGGGAPTVKYTYKADAQAEAERLAKTLDKRVYVLEAIGSCRKSDVTWEGDGPDDIPF
jgi:hypothetical protein